MYKYRINTNCKYIPLKYYKISKYIRISSFLLNFNKFLINLVHWARSIKIFHATSTYVKYSEHPLQV